VRAVAQYCTPDRQYGGLDDESLPRARTTFTSVCQAFSVPSTLRAVCLPFSLRLTAHNLPALVEDNCGLAEDDLLDVIHSRVYSTARTLRIREHWQYTTYRTEPAQPNDTTVSRFDCMIACLSLLRSQLPPRYHTTAMLDDKILGTVRGDWFAAPLLSGASHSNPHELAAHTKLLLATGLPCIRSYASLYAPRAPDAPAAIAFLTSPPPAPPAPPSTETWTVDTMIPDDKVPREVFYVLRRFRGRADRPCRTEASPARPYRDPGPANPCRICRGTDHFARTCPSNHPAKPAAPTAALLAPPTTTGDVLSRPPSPPPVAPAPGPPAADPGD